MKSNIKYSIHNLLLYLPGTLFALIGFIVCINENILVSIIYGVLLCIFLFGLFISIKDVQWYKVNNGYITVYCIFGVLKKIQLKEIKTVFKVNAHIFGLKMLAVYRPHIVLSNLKSIRKSNINDAYNNRKNKYIILPYTYTTELLIKEEYQKYNECELIIK
ncbi:MAG: hypothetical protein IJV68_08220 [Clostridia bacterium]|nr:hypothetical protein [Clostridia bacterium]MBQ9704507.1 hypothetical protein [Clostridia bacterium]